jgi:hypothetical protein
MQWHKAETGNCGTVAVLAAPLSVFITLDVTKSDEISAKLALYN